MNFILILIKKDDLEQGSEIKVMIDGQDVKNAIPIVIEKDDYWRIPAESLGILVQKAISKLL